MNEFDFLGIETQEETERAEPLLHGKYGKVAYNLLSKYREWNNLEITESHDNFFHIEVLQEALQHVCRISDKTDVLRSLGILNTVMVLDSVKAKKLAVQYLENMELESVHDDILMVGLYALLMAITTKSVPVARNSRLIGAILCQAMKNGELTYRKYIEYLRDGLDMKIGAAGWTKMRENLMLDNESARRFTIAIIDHIRGEWGGTY